MKLKLTVKKLSLTMQNLKKARKMNPNQNQNPLQLTVELEKGKEKRVITLKKPNRNVVSLALSAAMGGDVLSSTEVIIKNCYVSGTLTKDEILDEDNPEWLFALHQIVGQLIGAATAKLKN